MRKARPARAKWQGVTCTIGLILSLLWAPATHAESSSPPLSNAGPVLEDFGKQALDQSRPEAERLQIIALLKTWGTDQVRAPLVAILSDPSPTLRAAAANALGWKGNREAVPALQARLEAPGEPAAVRIAVLDALGRIGDDAVRPALETASRDADPAVRSRALQALLFENLKSSADTSALLRQTAGDKDLDLYVRSRAIQALSLSQEPATTELLMGLLEREPSAKMPALKDNPTRQEMMAIRFREARDVRAWAAMSLWRTDQRTAIPLLLKTADDPDDFFLRLISVQALGYWKVPEALPVLVKRLEDPLDQTRAAAAWGLGQIGNPSAVDPVAARLSDKVPDVRVQVVNALAELGDPRVRPQLEVLQETETHPGVQEALRKAIARLSH
jgi:HEAT repeat protein